MQSRPESSWLRLLPIVPFVVAVAYAVAGRPLRAAVLLLVAGLGLLAARRRPEMVLHTLHVVTVAATRSLTAVVTAGLWLLVVVPVSLLFRIAGHDPMAVQRSPRRRAPDRSTASWERGPRVRWWRPITLALVVMGTLTGCVGHTWSSPYGIAGYPYWPAVLGHQPDARAMFDYQARLPYTTDAELGWHNRSGSGPGTTLDGLARRSWRPAHPTATVWLIGGSAAFGIGQRDEHTIASELAREASGAGRSIEVVNYGTSGHQSHQEADLLDRLLTYDPAPDLVIVYHGTNDLAALCRRRAMGLDPSAAVGLESPAIEELLAPLTGFHPPGTTRAPQTCSGPEAGEELAIELDESMARIGHLLDPLDVPLLEVWQPDGLSLDAGAPDAELLFPRLDLDAQSNAQYQTVVDEALRLTPREELDLRGAFDEKAADMFDPVHHGERGSVIIAAALWPEVAALLPPPSPQ